MNKYEQYQVNKKDRPFTTVTDGMLLCYKCAMAHHIAMGDTTDLHFFHQGCSYRMRENADNCYVERAQPNACGHEA